MVPEAIGAGWGSEVERDRPLFTFFKFWLFLLFIFIFIFSGGAVLFVSAGVLVSEISQVRLGEKQGAKEQHKGDNSRS